MAQPRLKFWGWGYEGEVLASGELRWLERMWAQQFRVRQFDLTPPPTADEIHLRPSRLSIPAPLLPICTTEHYERLLHSYGASFPDSVRIFARDFSNPPPAVYFTFSALGNKPALLDQFWAIKIAATDALVKAGGTITHHHAVGRDHRRWYDHERPDLFASALRSVLGIAVEPRHKPPCFSRESLTGSI